MKWAWGAIALSLAAVSFGQKRPLDHSVYDGWRSLASIGVSRDGNWVTYVYTPQEGDSAAEIRSRDGSVTIPLARISTIRFTADSRYVVATQIPPLADTRKAQRDKVKPEDQPKNNLVIVDLATKTPTVIERVAAWSLPTDDIGLLLYRPEPKKADPAPAKPAEPAPKAEGAKEEKPTAEKPKDDKPKKKADHKPGQTYLLRTLATGAETTIDEVSDFAWSKDGKTLALAYSGKTGDTDRVEVRTLPEGRATEVLKGLGRYQKLNLTNDGQAFAFTTDRDDYTAKTPTPSLYLYTTKSGQAERITAPANPDDWIINANTTPTFSENGKRLIYGIGPKPIDPPDVPDDEKVSVDIWAYTDPLLQPMQLLQATQERNRTFTVIREIGSNKSRLIEDRELQDVGIADRGNGRYGLAGNDLPYRQLASWDGDFADYWVVDTTTGERRKLAEKVRGSAQFSFGGRWIVLTDESRGEVSVIDPTTGSRYVASRDIPTKLFDEIDDHPDYPTGYGFAGANADESRIYLFDRFDIWEVDPTGRIKPRTVTSGRLLETAYRPVRIDPDQRSFDPANSYYSTVSERTKEVGLARAEAGRFTQALSGPYAFALAGKARNADVFLYRQSNIDANELYVSDASFRGLKLTDTNPQQRDFNWLTVELVHWRSGDGQPLDGLLFKPENFDYTKKYPMISYFYERNSESLYQYRSPAPSASTINIPLFVSQGYLVFVPDIPYKIGYPGESAVSAIVSGVNSIVDRGYVDPKRLGIQGQSWGGYQVAYLVTETDMFAAAEAGAPVSNMFSAYGGIRYGSGMVRQFQYERQQSRIGGTPWDSFMRYVENSPLFFADKVKTPLMIMSNDKDGAVPHTQGIEYFTALRRLGKPAWMVVYNGEDHNLIQRKNRKDLSIRLSQFFDHYLKGAPMPVWMAEGVPAVNKGRTMGTELVKP